MANLECKIHLDTEILDYIKHLEERIDGLEEQLNKVIDNNYNLFKVIEDKVERDIY